ncbi:hypothetical protein [Thalassotalea maritima]|uniref:hypothetical protein n=1 Tax=Thalassotalea maritima TaxID=3242416 RepID=UPI0035273FC3
MQDLLSNVITHSPQFSELCSALYEREVKQLADTTPARCSALPARLKSLPHYVRRTAGSMLASQSPLSIDVQNASWSEKQASKLPLAGQSSEQIRQWYSKHPLPLGLVVPVLEQHENRQRIIIDCIDRVDTAGQRIRCNYSGWFALTSQQIDAQSQLVLLKPNKKVFIAACSGHQWRGEKQTQPQPLTLRELLLSCQINWQDMAKTLPLSSNAVN